MYCLFDPLVTIRTILDSNPSGRASFTQKGLHIFVRAFFASGMRAEG